MVTAPIVVQNTVMTMMRMMDDDETMMMMTMMMTVTVAMMMMMTMARTPPQWVLSLDTLPSSRAPVARGNLKAIPARNPDLEKARAARTNTVPSSYENRSLTAQATFQKGPKAQEPRKP